MKRIILICLCGGTLTLLSGMAVCALEGNPPCLPSKAANYTPAKKRAKGEKRPMLIISGKGGKIIDIREQGLQEAPKEVSTPSSLDSR